MEHKFQEVLRIMVECILPYLQSVSQSAEVQTSREHPSNVKWRTSNCGQRRVMIENTWEMPEWATFLFNTISDDNIIEWKMQGLAFLELR